MGIFSQSSGFDADVEKATSEKNISDNWCGIMDICDKYNNNPRTGKDCLKAIMKRMGHSDPHIAMQAITLLDACVSNCGEKFHLEVASREFEKEFRTLLNKAKPPVASKMRQVLKSWAEGDFKTRPELNLIPTLYEKLRSEGHDFTNLSDKANTTPNKSLGSAKDPNVVSSQQEQEDLKKAIELSLKEVKNSPNHQASSANTIASSTSNVAATTYPSLYPAFGATGGGGAGEAAATVPPEPRKVRALYDFEAAEENELTFSAGEIIHVTDDSDPNWWKGYNQRSNGLFPSNFVTSDLSVEPERLDIKNGEKNPEQKSENAVASSVSSINEIDELKIDCLIHLLNEANPEGPSQDTEEMLRLEQEVHQMGPLIDAELERVDRKHAQLSQLSSDLVDAINMYHSLMKDDRTAIGSSYMMSGMGVRMGTNMPGMVGGFSSINPHQQQMNMYGGAVPVNFAGTYGFGGMNTMPFHQVAPQHQVDTAAMSMPYQNGHVNAPHHQQQQQSVLSLNTPLNQQQQQQHQQMLGMGPPAPPSQMPLTHQVFANNIRIPSSAANAQAPLINPNIIQSGIHPQQQATPQASAPTANYQTLMAASAAQQQDQSLYITNNNVAAGGNTQISMNGINSINPQQQQQQQSAPSHYMSPQHQQTPFVNAVHQHQHQPQQQSQTSGIANNNGGGGGGGGDTQSSQMMYTNSMINSSGSTAYIPTYSMTPQHDQFGQLQQNLTNMNLAGGNAVHPPSTHSLGTPSYTQNLTQNIPIYQHQR